MSNWLTRAEKYWSSEDPRDRFLKGLPIKILVEWGVAFIIAFLASILTNRVNELDLVSLPVPELNGIIGGVSFAIILSVLWCDLIRQS